MEFKQKVYHKAEIFSKFDQIIELQLKFARFYDQEDGEIKEHDNSFNRNNYNAFFQITFNDTIYRTDTTKSNMEETYGIENTFHIDRVPQGIQSKGLGSHLFIEAYDYDHNCPKPTFIGYLKPISMQTVF